MALTDLLAALPPRVSVVIRNEADRETGEVWLGACCFLDPPEGGWDTEGDYFGHPPDHPRHHLPCPERWQFDPRVLFGTAKDHLWDGLESGLPGVIEECKRLSGQ